MSRNASLRQGFLLSFSLSNLSFRRASHFSFALALWSTNRNADYCTRSFVLIMGRGQTSTSRGTRAARTMDGLEGWGEGIDLDEQRQARGLFPYVPWVRWVFCRDVLEQKNRAGLLSRAFFVLFMGRAQRRARQAQRIVSFSPQKLSGALFLAIMLGGG